MSKPNIPMRPEDLPQQKVAPVVGLPDRPANFAVVLDSQFPLAPELRPPKLPRMARFLCMLEWAWGPGNDRLSAYFVSTNRQRSHWLLWLQSYDDHSDWLSSLYAYGPRRALPEQVAAIYLLHDALSRERDAYDFERFDWVAEEGLLAVPELLAIGREIWP